MTTLLDVTVQHIGWAGTTFAAAGWDDDHSPSITGLVARSFWCSSLNGQAIDQSVRFGSFSGPNSSPIWVNTHSASAIQGSVQPPDTLVTAGTIIGTYLRTPVQNGPILWRLVVSDQAVTPAPTRPACEYGTEPLPTSQPAVVLTQDLLNNILTVGGHLNLVPMFSPLVGIVLDVTGLCSRQPPSWPPGLSGPGPYSIGDLKQGLDSIQWSYWCHCVPGTPAPIDFPPPAVVVAPQPPAPTFPCDELALCSSISAIEQMVNQISGTLASNLELTTLLQRYHLPFAVIPGAFHNGLTGEGSFSIPRSIGIEVDIVSPPPSIVLPGVPAYVKDVGWMGFSIPAGMIAERRIARQHELWMPSGAEMATTFGWSLNPGVEINIRELYAEP